MTKALFLDFDGVVFPEKGDLPPFSDGTARMDPYAVLFINKLLEDAAVKLVISSSHARSGFDHCKRLLMQNNIDPSVLHADWTTPVKRSSERFEEIYWWLQNHPEITTYVAIDDLPLVDIGVRSNFTFVKYAVRCDMYNGLTYANYLECRYHLNQLFPNETKEGLLGRVNYHKKREVSNVISGIPGRFEINKILEDNFPRIVVKDHDAD